jgi:tRNA (guanosine-2'-O-)-methyltransferase
MNQRREEKFRKVTKYRQPNLTVILENVHDPHNISAVLRSCDSVGIIEIYVLYTSVEKEKLLMGKRTSMGARKWVDVHLFNDVTACFEAVRAKYDRIYATHLNENATDFYALDLTQSVALLFGNEKDGVSNAALANCDGNFIIPQVGMVESLNISVACAVTLYEAFRQRQQKGFFDKNPLLSETEHQILFEDYVQRHEDGLQNRQNYTSIKREK